MRAALMLLASVAVLAAGMGAAPQVATLPEEQAFFDAVRENVARAQRLQNRYAYRERRTDVHTNPFGRIGTGGTRVLEVVPAPDGLSATRRLIERNSVPVAGSEPEQINLAPRRNPRARSGLDDVVRTLEFRIERRDVREGRRFIVIAFGPRPDADPETRQGRMAKAFRGRMWVDEQASEIEHIEATAVEDISVGLGLVARIGKGATVTAERRPVDGGIWLPTALRFDGEGRALLFRKLDVDYAIDWFDYRLVVDAP